MYRCAITAPRVILTSTYGTDSVLHLNFEQFKFYCKKMTRINVMIIKYFNAVCWKFPKHETYFQDFTSSV